MKRLRIVMAAAVAATALVAGTATAHAAGTAPQGQGLGSLTGQTDIQLSNLTCDDASISDMLVARGGNAGWVIGDPDSMYVLKSVSGAGTVTSTAGVEAYQFNASYGKKTGASSLLTCEAHYLFDGGDVVDEGHMQWTLVRIW